jgi:endonuclease/exonuclease/phosphatase family metal-dependent hydrolase
MYEYKYRKYKIKYLDLLNGGALNKPTMIPDTPYNVGSLKQINKSVSVTNPYIASEFDRTEKKKDILNSIHMYAKFMNFNSPNAYEFDQSKVNDEYCIRNEVIPQKKIGALRIVSYNVHNWVKQCKDKDPKIIRKIPFAVGRNENATLTMIYNFLSDIVFLQEIVPIYKTQPTDDASIEKGNFEPLVHKFALMGLNYYFIGDTHYSEKPSALDAGFPYFMLCNATFSKYPIIESKTVELGNNRIVVVCVIKILENKHVATYNVHIEHDEFAKDYSGTKLKYKQIQINNLANIIYSDSITFDTKYPGIVYILGGDFNNTFQKNIINTKTIPDMGVNFTPITDMLTYVEPELSVLPTDNQKKMTGQNVSEIIDHFFVSKNAKFVDNKPKTLIIPVNDSDHYPILIDLDDLITNVESGYTIPTTAPKPSPILIPSLSDSLLNKDVTIKNVITNRYIYYNESQCTKARSVFILSQEIKKLEPSMKWRIEKQLLSTDIYNIRTTTKVDCGLSEKKFGYMKDHEEKQGIATLALSRFCGVECQWGIEDLKNGQYAIISKRRERNDSPKYLSVFEESTKKKVRGKEYTFKEYIFKFVNDITDNSKWSITAV